MISALYIDYFSMDGANVVSVGLVLKGKGAKGIQAEKSGVADQPNRFWLVGGGCGVQCDSLLHALKNPFVSW